MRKAEDILNDQVSSFPRTWRGPAIAAIRQAQQEVIEEAAKIADLQVQRARDAVAECRSWSAAQAEWSRARDLGLDIAENIRAIISHQEG